MAILKYKNAEGKFVPLNNYVVLPITVSQTTGTSTTETMSLDAITRALGDKVDKILGKGLSTNDYTTAEKEEVAKIANKVDKEAGKGLSTNDYTTAEKTKLSNISAGAEVNVQSDWSVTDTDSDAFIKNKPGNASTTVSGLMSAADKSKLDGIAANANNYSLPKASATVLGGIKVGNNLTIDADGKLNGVNSYTLPKATSTVLGGVKTGSNITNTDGTISLTKDNVTSALGMDPSTVDTRYFRAYSTADDNIDSDWGLSVITFDPKPSGTPANSSLNVTLLSLGSHFNRRKMLAFPYETDDIYYRRRMDNSFKPWVKLWNSGNDGSDSGLDADLLDGKHADALVNGDSNADWYGVSWSENSSNPDCTRIGNMDMHRTLPILSMMRGYIIGCRDDIQGIPIELEDNFSKSKYSHNDNNSINNEPGLVAQVEVMVKIPEFWYIDEYISSTKTHNLKISEHSKSGWNHHKESYVGAYEGTVINGLYTSIKNKIPTVNVNRTTIRTAARANSVEGDYKWNIYTYEEHRAICHLFLVEYATRNSQKAVNTSLTAEGFRQGGLGSGCTTGTVTINGATTYSFIPTGSSDSLGNGSGEVTVTIQLTDASGNNTSTVTRKCNRYRGIENPFGHVWKHTDDIISIYKNGFRTYYKSIKPDLFSTNKNVSYKPLTTLRVVTGFKTEIKATTTCDFFAVACTNGSESTYWCDYNYDNTDATEHCLLIGGCSGTGGTAGLFFFASNDGVGHSYALIGSRLTYLPWAE